MIQGPNFIYVETPFCDPYNTYKEALLSIEGTFELTPLYEPLSENNDGFTSFTIIRRPYERLQYFSEKTTGRPDLAVTTWQDLKQDTLDFYKMLEHMSYWTNGVDKVIKAHDYEDFIEFMNDLGHTPDGQPPLLTSTKLAQEDREYIKRMWRNDFLNHNFPYDARRNM